MDVSESWTIKKAEHQRIDALELWCYRRLFRVPQTARRSNQSILKEISPEYSLEGLMLKLKLQCFGHPMQRDNWLEKTLMLGKTEGRRRRGWQRMNIYTLNWVYIYIYTHTHIYTYINGIFSSVTHLCLTLFNPMDCSKPGFPVHNQLSELTQTQVHRLGDTIQPYTTSSLSIPLLMDMCVASCTGYCK